MIVFPSRKLVLATPPHTASRHIHQALCGDRYGGQTVWTPSPDGQNYDHHGCRLASEFQDFKLALVVRHPLDRLTGLWRHWLWWHSQHEPDAVSDLLSFVGFALAVAQDRDDMLSWLYRYTITRLLGWSQRIDVLVRFEVLQADLESLLQDTVTLPPPYPKPHPPWQQLCGDYPVPYAAACAWAWPDAHRFGYDLKLDPPQP